MGLEFEMGLVAALILSSHNRVALIVLMLREERRLSRPLIRGLKNKTPAAYRRVFIGKARVLQGQLLVLWVLLWGGPVNDVIRFLQLKFSMAFDG